MTLDPQLLSAAALIGLIGLAVWVALLQRTVSTLRRRLRAVLNDADQAGLDEVFERTQSRVETLGVRVEALNALQKELAGLTERSLQRVGVVRFNPFADTGGDQSFAIAILDARGDGIVISSLHSRSDTRVFAKSVTGGRSAHQLSDEEQGAIRQALAPQA